MARWVPYEKRNDRLFCIGIIVMGLGAVVTIPLSSPYLGGIANGLVWGAIIVTAGASIFYIPIFNRKDWVRQVGLRGQLTADIDRIGKVILDEVSDMKNHGVTRFSLSKLQREGIARYKTECGVPKVYPMDFNVIVEKIVLELEKQGALLRKGFPPNTFNFP